jgi:hypothetical protein
MREPGGPAVKQKPIPFDQAGTREAPFNGRVFLVGSEDWATLGLWDSQEGCFLDVLDEEEDLKGKRPISPTYWVPNEH